MFSSFYPLIACILLFLGALICFAAAHLIPHFRKLLIACSICTLMVVVTLAYCIWKQFFLNEPLVIAAEEGNIVVVNELLSKGASPDAYGVDGVTTALMNAACAGHTEIVKLLLQKGANTALKDLHGKTALQRARETGNTAVIYVLLKAEQRMPGR